MNMQTAAHAPRRDAALLAGVPVSHQCRAPLSQPTGAVEDALWAVRLVGVPTAFAAEHAERADGVAAAAVDRRAALGALVNGSGAPVNGRTRFAAPPLARRAAARGDDLPAHLTGERLAARNPFTGEGAEPHRWSRPRRIETLTADRARSVLAFQTAGSGTTRTVVADPRAIVAVRSDRAGFQTKHLLTTSAGTRDKHPLHIPLMRWLCRMVTPPGGVVLDCFAGSGTTRLAALAEGFRCILIEQQTEYLEQLCGRAAQTALALDGDAAG